METKKQDKVTTETLAKNIEQFSYHGGYQPSVVFDDLLRYIINGYTLPEKGNGIKGWGYKKEENRWFWEMAGKLAIAMKPEIEKRGWYDVLGGIYESIIAGKSRRSYCGQFFTPIDLCDLMTEITTYTADDKRGGVVGDPCCGSGRTLLSFNAKHGGHYFIAEDLDETCAMMTVVNFLYHGIRGEVVWHDALCIEPVWAVWKVNNNIRNPFFKFFGIPHVEPISWDESWLGRSWKNGEERTRLRSKLQDNVRRLENQLKSFRSITNPSAQIQAKIHHLQAQVDKIQKVIKQSYS